MIAQLLSKDAPVWLGQNSKVPRPVSPAVFSLAFSLTAAVNRVLRIGDSAFNMVPTESSRGLPGPSLQVQTY